MFNSPITEKTLKIVWTPPEIGASCVKHYRVTLTNEPLKGITNTTTENEMYFKDLFPCTSYTLQITAVDMENGDSNFELIPNTSPTLPSGRLKIKKALI